MQKTILSSYVSFCPSVDYWYLLRRKKRLAGKRFFCYEQQLSITLVSIWVLIPEALEKSQPGICQLGVQWTGGFASSYCWVQYWGMLLLAFASEPSLLASQLHVNPC